MKMKNPTFRQGFQNTLLTFGVAESINVLPETNLIIPEKYPNLSNVSLKHCENSPDLWLNFKKANFVFKRVDNSPTPDCHDRHNRKVMNGRTSTDLSLMSGKWGY